MKSLQVEMSCPCGTLILKSYEDGTTKLRSKILLFKAHGGGVAVCRNCGREHVVPIRLSKSSPLSNELQHFIFEKVVDS